MVDDIFWNMAFKNQTYVDRVILWIMFVMLVSCIMLIMIIILIILLIYVRIELGLADRVWQDKHAAIA